MSTSTTSITAAQGTSNQQSSSNSNNAVALPLDDFHLSSSQLLGLLDSKDDAVQVLKSDLMDVLNKEVKSLDEDNWMFEGPRSRINLISKPAVMESKTSSSFPMKNSQPANWLNFGPPK